MTRVNKIKKQFKEWAFYPSLRFEVSNGQTLCKKCHNFTKKGPFIS